MQRVDSRAARSHVMMPAFFGGRSHGKGKITAETGGVVEGRCQEFAGVCEESIVWDPGGEEVASLAGRRGAEGDEIGSSVSFGTKEIGRPLGPPTP